MHAPFTETQPYYEANPNPVHLPGKCPKVHKSVETTICHAAISLNVLY
jgi:hypothetical protein